jgi:bifunctional non-homologous end joining protein LigD
MPAKAPARVIEVDGRELAITSPDKLMFPDLGLTKWDLVAYYLAVGPGALLGVRNRPTVLKRFPNGIGEPFFFQKRVSGAPEWLQTVTTSTSNGTPANELCTADLAHLIWAINMGCVDLNPWPARSDNVDLPDELRIDLDPQPGVPFQQVRAVATVVREVLHDFGGLVGWPKTSGSRGIHIYVRIRREWDATQVRNAAVMVARETERRAPAIATAKWWKEERGERVFIDFNQNARDRTIASAYSIRPVPDARVSAPFGWDELDAIELADFTVATMPARFAEKGDMGAGIDATAYGIEALLERLGQDEAAGIPDAPWPPQFRKQPGEARRVQPSKAKKTPAQAPEQTP